VVAEQRDRTVGAVVRQHLRKRKKSRVSECGAAQGSMLWSQLSSIFCQFSAKIGVFLKNQCYDQIFSKTSCSLSKKRQYFR
jgi:hypothetical protein